MVAVNEIFRECLAYSEEREWFEFKENSFDRDTVGEYISALSNSAAIIGRSFAFMFWGVNDKTHHVSGTKINYNKEIENEPVQHYIARNLNPSVPFFFQDFEFEGKRVVCLSIPAAKIIRCHLHSHCLFVTEIIWNYRIGIITADAHAITRIKIIHAYRLDMYISCRCDVHADADISRQTFTIRIACAYTDQGRAVFISCQSGNSCVHILSCIQTKDAGVFPG